MKKSLKVLSRSVLGAGAALFAAGELVYNVVLTKKGTELTAKLMPAIDDEYNEIAFNSPIAKESEAWFNNADIKMLTTFADNGKKLDAYYIPAEKESNVFVICCHGYADKVRYMANYAMNFSRMGYNVLLPALGGHDINQDSKISMGWFDRFIIVAWAKYLAENYPQCEIILHGVSMGGAAVMMATGERMPENVKCCVEDCGYTCVDDVFRVQMREFVHLPAFPLLTVTDAVCRLHGKYSFKEASALEQVKKSVTPTLFIHGDRDTFVPFWMQYPLYKYAVCEKEKLTVPGAVHAVSAFINPELYWSTVEKFIAKYINK